MDLFDRAAEADATARAPLAERMRPRSLDEYVGQEHLTGPGRLLRRAIEADAVPSMIFWGPPGTGKTTLARVIAKATGAHFEAVSAVAAGVKELREAVAGAEERFRFHRRRSILFVDEIHRFNKAQQDALLPHVERGTVTLLGATTENPSFEVNAALLSRLRVVTLRGLEEDELRTLLRRAIADQRGLAGQVDVSDDALALIANVAAGDARRALTALELAARQAALGAEPKRADGAATDGSTEPSPVALAAASATPDAASRAPPKAAPVTVPFGAAAPEPGRRPLVDRRVAEEALQQRTLLYDKQGEEHFNVVSAFIKSMRGSDPDAAVYWMARMLEAGEDVRFVARRMLIFASEDVGNADPRALQLALAAMQAAQVLGLPEATLPLTQAVTYLALAPKANTAISTYAKAKAAVEAHGPLPVPLHLRNAPTRLMKTLGYGAGYQYPHDFEGHFVVERYLPDDLRAARFFEPSEQGEERHHAARLRELLALRAPIEPGADG